MSINIAAQSLHARLAACPPEQVAEAAVAMWQALSAKFGPLIGPASVRFLLTRSLELQQHAYPWLPSAFLAGVAEPPFAALHAALQAQAAEAVLKATAAMVDSFAEQLANLIGVSLTAQFLLAVYPADGAPPNY